VAASVVPVFRACCRRAAHGARRASNKLAGQGKRLPPESLLLIAENSMAMAERYQPELTDPTTREKSPNPLHNDERYAFWLAASREAYKADAPYYAPGRTRSRTRRCRRRIRRR
jgi:hypothetical protein